MFASLPSLLFLILVVELTAASHLDQLPFIREDVKVPVQLGVMSRCPDALFCESVFNDVLTHVSEKIDLSLLFIAKINSSEPEYGVTCMHGRQECAGNVQELCAVKYAPVANWWQFLQCQNSQGLGKIGTPQVALQCAKLAGIDWEASGAGACAGLDGSGKGTEGVQLLQQSVRDSQALGIRKSCTVLINSKPVCVHDGTWKECKNGHSAEDFVRQINSEHKRLNSDSDNFFHM